MSPAKNSSPPTASPTLIWSGSNPPMSSWSANFGSGASRWTSWKIVCVVNSPRTALIATQVGAISQTWLWPRIRR